MKKRAIFIYTVFFLFLSVCPVRAELGGELFDKDKPVHVEGDVVSYDSELRRYNAKGNVVVSQEGTVLTADRVVMDMEEGWARATGNVRLTDEKGDYLNAQRLTINMDDDTAIAQKSSVFLTDINLHIMGDEIRKEGKDLFYARRATFTTCDCPEGSSPAWSFYTSRARFRIEGFFTATNMFFYVKGVPVLYTPFMALPVKRKRQTGFLTPKFGYSRLRGYKLDNAFFWAISRSQDATFYLDVETERGVGKGIEYRYYRTARSFGTLYVYHFKEKDIDRVREFRSGVDNLSRPLSASNNRWRFDFKHTEFLPHGFTVKADIRLVSDDEYFIDFAKNPKERSLESIESNLSISKGWERYNLTAQFRVFDNLLLKDDSSVLQRLPEVNFTASAKSIPHTPLFWSLESSFVNFERKEGTRGQRLDVAPKITLPLKPWRLFELTPAFRPRFTLYHTPTDMKDPYYSRYIYEASIDATTTLVRYFSVEGKTIDRLRHTIRPKITYTYIPPLTQTKLPQFDGLDNIAPKNEIRYSLNTTLTGMSRKTWKRHQYLYMDIGQSYNIREVRGDSRVDPKRKRPFSDVDAEVIITPSDWMTITSKAKYDVYDKRFESYDALFSARGSRGGDISVVYRFIRDSVEYLEANINARLTQSIMAGYRQRYSFIDNESIEKQYSMEYSHQCWGLSLRYMERLEEDVLLFMFTLRGIGDVFGGRAVLREG